MSLAENLLNTLPDGENNMVRTGGSVEEGHITVDERRIIHVPEELRAIAVTGDKDIETVTIDCVRYWDGHDLSTFDIYLNYTLPRSSAGKPKEGSYSVPPESITVSESIFSFDWTIGKEIAKVPGTLVISISAVETDSYGDEIRQWGSFPNNEMSIIEGLSIAGEIEDDDNGGNGGSSGGSLPPVTTEDNGKILQVVGGTWQAVEAGDGTGIPGPQGPQGPRGPVGPQGPAGPAYELTEDDKADIVAAVLAELPSGGTAPAYDGEVEVV